MIQFPAGKSDKILAPMYPLVLTRPGPQKQTWMITSPPADRRQVARHWNKEANRTEACQCTPPCQSSRQDYFTGAQLLRHTDTEGHRHWEPVILHLTEQTVRSIYSQMRTRGDNGDLCGMLVMLSRMSGPNGRVAVHGILRVPDRERMRINVDECLLQRLHITAGFFGKRLDDDEDSELGRSDPPRRNPDPVKPRVAKGRG